jgi:hypothetical protein
MIEAWKPMYEWVRRVAQKTASRTGLSEPPMNGAAVSGTSPAARSLRVYTLDGESLSFSGKRCGGVVSTVRNSSGRLRELVLLRGLVLGRLLCPRCVLGIALDLFCQSWGANVRGNGTRMELRADAWKPAILDVGDLANADALNAGAVSLVVARTPGVALKAYRRAVERAIEAIADIQSEWRVVLHGNSFRMKW